MAGIKHRIGKAVDILMAHRRQAYHRRKARKLQNCTASIISKDCIGGIVYHDLSLRFLSPTINLMVEADKFILFAKELPGYLAAEVQEITLPGSAYPVGQITYKGQPINLYFMHYKTFSEAKAKWEERSKRVNWDNIAIIHHAPSDISASNIAEFEKLPYKRKMIIASKNPTNSPCVKVLDVYNKPDYYSGKSLEYKSRFSVKRYIDDIDFISFLNA